ncbi:MAG: exo-alpha-sialidase [Saccharothrix sp.]|nr:exo-alpha-sialidase [Saccharothrix sp.]
MGPIGTLPRYFEAGLVSDGDPAVAFGPRPGPNGTFSWSNGSRLYYANLTSNFSANRKLETFRGVEAIAVSATDDVRAAAAGNANAWTAPVIISKQSSTTFSDKEQVYADNAESSRFFGRVYVCWSSFRSNSHGNALPIPLTVARSADGGRTWSTQQFGPASSNGVNQQADGCVVRTDSTGNVYVFGVGARGGTNFQLMYKSTDGGAHFAGPTLVAPVVKPGVFDPVAGRPVMDGIAGARVDLAGGPNVDIANGRPTGAGATDELFMTWSDGRAGLNNEQLMLTWSPSGGTSWVAPAPLALTAGDRPVYTAPAVSPDGTDLYIVHNSFTTPYRTNTTDPRGLVGEVRHANVAGGVPSGWTTLERAAGGDPRASSANALISEFLGDYVYAAATNDRAVAVWNDAHNGAVCPSINAYRASLYTASPSPAPNVLATCPATFGNTDILGGSYPDPTP